MMAQHASYSSPTPLTIIIPAHLPKANYLMGYIASLSAAQEASHARDIQVVVAATNHAEWLFFLKLVRSLPFLVTTSVICIEEYLMNSLNLPSVVERLRADTARCSVNLKKWAALHWYAHWFNEGMAICIDADTLCVSNSHEIRSTIELNYGKKFYPGGITTNALFEQINRGSAVFFSESDQSRLATITQNFKLYNWFFDVPSYDASDLRFFFDFVARQCGSLQKFLELQTWHSFEHLTFMYFRMLVQEASSFDLGRIGIEAYPEDLTGVDLIMIKNASGYCPSWMQLGAWFNDPVVAKELPNISMLYHVDRWRN